MTTLDQSKPADEARDSLLRSGAVSSCNDLLPGQPLTLIKGDCRTVLKTLPAESVQCCVTSPPYWGLRDYGHADQIGQEESPDAYVQTMREVFAEVWRVLKADGTLWLNLGDSYNAYNGNRGPSKGINKTNHEALQNLPTGHGLSAKNLKPKDLCGIPWRVALALQSDGWYLRSDIIWAKTNCMPESIIDRPTRSHEYIFLLTKRDRYYYDHEAIKERSTESTAERGQYGWNGKMVFTDNKEIRSQPDPVDKMGERWCPTMRNKRSVWTVPTASYREAHFATFPEDLIRPCIIAGCPIGGTVLDPFGGSGTTGLVAYENGRHAVLIELNEEYAKLINERLTTTPGLPLAD